MFSPNRVLLFDDRVEERKDHAIRKSHSNTIRFDQMAQVAIRKGLVYSDVTVESSGGHTITLEGLPNAAAAEVKSLIDGSWRAWREAQRAHHAPPPPPAAAASLGDELKKLVDLRDAGILSDDEFASAKARLLS